jgi:hypothetical protein
MNTYGGFLILAVGGEEWKASEDGCFTPRERVPSVN